MRRVRYAETGGPEVLRVEETAVPVPGPGEVLVRTEAIGLTLPVVRKVREGGLPLPTGPGGEVAGEIAAVGAGVTGFAVGDRVTGLCFTDAFADFALVHTAMLSSVPEGASAADAVALVRCGLVALGAYEAARPSAGESVLVTAAAGGSGHLAVQIAKARGAGRVVAAVSSADKAEFARSLGADEVVTYGDESWGDPVDIVLDAVGGQLLSPAIAALAPGGRIVAYSSGGGTIEAYDLLVGAKSAIGFQMALIARERPELMERWRRELWELFAAGRIRPRVDSVLPLEDVAKAFGIIESRANLGKVILRPV
ncbi:quinone oxidoreductase family protein [Streptomyces hesseae]|uniref:Zinc-binding dehydrogenase n=1 Tax=Streptomyces hesseae TaxID=3075519 RepID=A0ABU2SJP9_9ACTN|nr:zinc-binding dehydrogenase [Streptomyces sp. DSM 40473]MDT0449125.1 zinc-binding dehydrogenase [Streptomyces sp. DSM 40473]